MGELAPQSLPAEVDEDPAEVVGVLLDSVVEGLDLRLCEEAQDPLLQLPAALASDDLDRDCLGPDGLVEDPPQRLVDLVAPIVDVMQVELQLHYLVVYTAVARRASGVVSLYSWQAAQVP